MIVMPRAMWLTVLWLVSSLAAAGQTLSVLHIKVVVLDAERKPTPVPRHVLLISDNPTSAPPRQVITALDGTAEIRLRPGNYTVESDRPVMFSGKAYQWTQMLDIVAGRDAVLELTADNAEVEPIAATASAASSETDPAFLLLQWQNSVVTLWTATTYASGFLIDAKGLIATNQRVVGTATSVEVQLSPAVKVAASVLAADSARDVAVLWIDPTAAASVRPVPLGCAEAAKTPVAGGQALYAIDIPFRAQKGMASGTVSRVEPHGIVADLMLSQGSAGGPVFAAGGRVVGITTVEDDRSRRAAARVVPIADACEVVAAAEKKMKDAARPDGTPLPVEPVRPFPMSTLKETVQRRAGSLNPYQMSSAEFDLAFITPVHIYGAKYQAEQMRDRERTRSPRATVVEPALVRPLLDFANWSEYVADLPPVLLIRVTPKLVENFWTTVARGAARTQGVSLPPIKRVKSGFSRMRAFCGDAEITPIHPFKLEQRVSENDAVYEGLYVFDPGAIGSHCGAARLVLVSDKQPEKGDTLILDPKVLQQIWQDFAAYREP
jgi:S1-C subfamily serine protease